MQKIPPYIFQLKFSCTIIPLLSLAKYSRVMFRKEKKKKKDVIKALQFHQLQQRNDEFIGRSETILNFASLPTTLISRG